MFNFRLTIANNVLMKTSLITVLSLYMYIHIVNQLIAATHTCSYTTKAMLCVPLLASLVSYLINWKFPLMFSTHSSAATMSLYSTAGI